MPSDFCAGKGENFRKKIFFSCKKFFSKLVMVHDSVHLLSRAVPACPADGVQCDVRPVNVVHVSVPVQRHGALYLGERDDDIGLDGRVKRYTANIRTTCKHQETTQV